MNIVGPLHLHKGFSGAKSGHASSRAAVCRIVSFCPLDSCGVSPAATRTCGVLWASQPPTPDLGQPVGAGLATQQADLGRRSITLPEIVAMGPRWPAPTSPIDRHGPR